MKFPRRSGVVFHPTSLPGRFGIGDLGQDAFRFVDFLQAAGQAYWQVLPLTPTGYADSPYLCFSALAGNPLLISPDKLVEQGHLAPTDLENVPAFPIDHVDFGWVIQYKTQLLNRAFENFKVNADKSQRSAFKKFCNAHSVWLEDFALFMAIKESNQMRSWYEWDDDLKMRDEQALARARKSLADQIENQKYRQWQFFSQWLAVKQYANERGIRIIGDIPIFVAYDSAEVWASPQVFQLDKKLNPTVVTGVPPDYFSKDGQLWGHPHYRWNVMAKDNYAWWIERFKMAFLQADVARIDHFRGFYDSWEVPAGEKTAIKGRWVKGPGAKVFRAVTEALGEVAIIAEDLGDFTPEARAGLDAIQAEFGFPGMKVINFAFSSDANDPFLPHNFTRDYIAYTGTHDNDTAVGWYQETSTEHERDYARRYLARDGSDIAWDLIRLAWGSIAHTAMTTAQDLLGLGHFARMNTPSTVGAPNWCWRMLPNALNDGIAARLREMTWVYGRLAEKD